MEVTPAALAEEIKQLTHDGQILIAQFYPITAFQVVALLQLVLRHPNLSGFNRAAAEELVDDFEGWFREIGAAVVVAAIEMGRDPRHDVASVPDPEPRIVIP